MNRTALTATSSDRGTAIAAAEGLGFAYPDGRVALRGISGEIRRGHLTVLSGDSGSGKSTFLRALCGLIPHFHGGRMDGRVLLDGLDTRRARPEQLARHAGMLFQDPERQSVHRSVLRDVAFGLGNIGVAPGRIRPAVVTALEEVGVGHLIERRLDELSGGERQRVALAGVLACGQALILLDEPASQMDGPGRGALSEILDRLRHDGRAVVISDHGGSVTGNSRLQLRDGALVPEGHDAEESPDMAFPIPGDDLLVARGLVVHRGPRTVVVNQDLSLARGEVRALVGPNGVGKTTLLMALAGVLGLDAGEVHVGGRRVSGRPLSERFPATALIPQDPRLFFLTERVGDDVAVGLRGRPLTNRNDVVADALALFGLAGIENHHPLDLSSGQRQRVALAAAWAQGPDILLLDEPTRGLDRAQREMLIGALGAHAWRGGAALVATHDPDLAAALPGPPVRLGVTS